MSKINPDASTKLANRKPSKRIGLTSKNKLPIPTSVRFTKDDLSMLSQAKAKMDEHSSRDFTATDILKALLQASVDIEGSKLVDYYRRTF